jgi:thymidylate synthase (FAD)
MILIRPSHKILFISPKPLETIEAAGRTCYKSEDKITEGSAEKFVRMIIKRGHLSVIEHAMMRVRFICDRGITHEIVRHRLAAYSQESTRYCNYGKVDMRFIIPGDFKLDSDDLELLGLIENHYNKCLNEKHRSPQQARYFLPNGLKTEIVMTANLREWMHVFKLRTSKAAHPQMRELMIPLLKEINNIIPVLFEELVASL